MSSKIRHIRVTDLYNRAKSGKYNWEELKTIARCYGVSEPTVTSYLNTVEAMLKKAGYIK